MGTPRSLVFKSLLVTLILVGSFIAPSALRLPTPTARAAHACVSPCISSFYGANTTRLNSAKAPGGVDLWPQLGGPYCAIATTMVIANYDYLEQSQPVKSTQKNQQESKIAHDNRIAGQSQWGYVPQGGLNVAGYTNISGDFGTDPRSIAYMEWNYTPTGYYLHNYIYRWEFSNITSHLINRW
jgi:hypothetical protein